MPTYCIDISVCNTLARSRGIGRYVAYLAAALERLRSDLEDDGSEPSRPLPSRYALYVGATDPRKRVELLVRCYGQVFERTGVPLVLVGSWLDGVSAELTRAIAAGPEGAVVPVGEVADHELPALYRGADVFVLPSVYEGFGLPVLEAMASGCPVVTTRGGALEEVGGAAAHYVAGDDPAGLATSLIELLSDESARAALRKNGLERVKAFSWSRCARATLEVYRWAAGRSPGPRGSGEVWSA